MPRDHLLHTAVPTVSSPGHSRAGWTEDPPVHTTLHYLFSARGVASPLPLISQCQLVRKESDASISLSRGEGGLTVVLPFDLK